MQNKTNSTATYSESSNFSFVPQNVITVSTPILQKKNQNANIQQGAKSVTFPERYRNGENRNFAKSPGATPTTKNSSQMSQNSQISYFTEPGSSSSMNSQFASQSSIFPSISEPPPLNIQQSYTSSFNSSRIPPVSDTSNSDFPSTTTTSKDSSFLTPISEDTNTTASFSTSRTNKSSSKTSSSFFTPIQEDSNQQKQQQRSYSYKLSKSSSFLDPVSDPQDKTTRSALKSAYLNNEISDDIPSSLLPVSKILGSDSSEEEDEENTETVINYSKQNTTTLLEEEEEEEAAEPIQFNKSNTNNKSQQQQHKSNISNKNSLLEEEEEEEEEKYEPKRSNQSLKYNFNQQIGTSPFNISKKEQKPQNNDELKKLQEENAILVQSLQKLAATMLTSFNIRNSSVNPAQFSSQNAEEIAESVDTLCEIQNTQVQSLKSRNRNSGSVSNDVKQLTDSIIERIKGYEEKLEKQHKEFTSWFK